MIVYFNCINKIPLNINSEEYIFKCKRFESFLSSIWVCYTTWLVYLIDRKFDDEPELKCKIALLLHSANIDYLKKFNSNYRKLCSVVGATDYHYISCLYHSQIIFDEIIRYLNDIPMEYQAFYWMVRNQWVHGYHEGYLNKNINFPCVINGEYIIRNVSAIEFDGIVKPVWRLHDSAEEAASVYLGDSIINNGNILCKMSNLRNHYSEILINRGVNNLFFLQQFFFSRDWGDKWLYCNINKQTVMGETIQENEFWDKFENWLEKYEICMDEIPNI
jgi:hypothetical protein